MMMFLSALALYSSSQAPATKCEIAMEKWCIVQLTSTVQMKDTGLAREWTISLNQDVVAANIRIVEDKFCDGELRFDRIRNAKNEFTISSSGNCGLRVSVYAENQSVDSQALLYQIIMLRKDNRWLPLNS